MTRARQLWALRIAEAARSGSPLLCRLCGLPVLPGQPFDLGHPLALSEGGSVTDYRPEHRSACNRREGGQIGARAKRNRATRVRRWL